MAARLLRAIDRRVAGGWEPPQRGGRPPRPPAQRAECPLWLLALSAPPTTPRDPPQTPRDPPHIPPEGLPALAPAAPAPWGGYPPAPLTLRGRTAPAPLPRGLRAPHGAHPRRSRGASAALTRRTRPPRKARGAERSWRGGLPEARPEGATPPHNYPGL